MEHFSEQNWVDLVRGVGSSEATQAMQSHLASGCAECKAAVAFWGRLASVAAKETECAAPADLVRLVKLQFGSQRPAEPTGWMIASMIFDSATQPLPMGVRGGAASTRQVVYEAEGLTVDLRFERKQHSNTILAAGQVLDRESPLCWLSNAAVVLWTDKGQMVTKTVANDYGEFQFEFEHQDQLRISIITASRRTLRIALGNLE
jgi:hypothetical protein